MSELVERLRKGADDASLDCYAMCEEAADRIEALEAALITEWAARDNRIEALEAALREIAGQMLIDEHDEDYNGDYEAGYEAIVRIARAALAPEHQK